MQKSINSNFDPPLRNSGNLLSERVSAFIGSKCVKSVPMKYLDFKPPKLHKGKRWYISYYYRVPKELQHKYPGEVWHRFRVSEDVNRYKDVPYAEIVVAGVLHALEHGYNPFEDEKREAILDYDSDEKQVTIKEGLELFLEYQKGKGLEKDSVERYISVCRAFNTWLVQKNIYKKPAGEIKRSFVEAFLKEYKTIRGISNRQYNNMKSYLHTAFEFLRKKQFIHINPVSDIESLKTKSLKHKYYDKVLFPKVTSIIKENEPYLWYAVQFVYYLAVRSSKELTALKVKDIIEGGEAFAFRAEVTKSDRDEIIPVDPYLRQVLKEMKLEDYKPDDYIFTIKEHPGKIPASENFFARKFRNIRKLAGLSQYYTLYGFRHTRAVHLAKDGVNITDIMKLFRHTDIATTSIYLRGLGVDFDAKDLHSKSRKI
jgi:integrase